MESIMVRVACWCSLGAVLLLGCGEDSPRFLTAVEAQAAPPAGDRDRLLGALGSKGGVQAKEAAAPADVAEVPAEDLRVEGLPRMRYFLFGPRKGVAPPKEGFKVMVVIPGGDGGAASHSFVRRLYELGMPEDFVLAQLVAVRWSPNQQIVWPTRDDAVEGQEFATEDFVAEVVKDVSRRRQIDRRHVYTLAWSSSGPAAYQIALEESPVVTGSYIAMSAYRLAKLPPIERAKKRLFLIEHSPKDRICPYRDAQAALRDLQDAGATVKLVTYEGGHGWRGAIYRRVAENVAWLVEQTRRRGDAPGTSR